MKGHSNLVTNFVANFFNKLGMLESVIKKNKTEKRAGVSDLNASGKRTLGTQKKMTQADVKGITTISSSLCLGTQFCLEGNRAKQILKSVGTI